MCGNNHVYIVQNNCTVYRPYLILSIILLPVNCSDPSPPTDVSIYPYLNTTEGAEISFMCNPGFVPTDSMTAVCGADRRWSPDPADLVCACEYPSTAFSCLFSTC